MKRIKMSLGLAIIFCLCATPAGAQAENAPKNFLLSKYSAYQTAQYQVQGLSATDSRICVHGDKTGVDVYYTGTLRKTVQLVGTDTLKAQERQLSFWMCQSKVLNHQDVKQMTDTQKVLAVCAREARQTYLREIGDVLSSSFIELTVEDVQTKETFGNRVPVKAGHQFIAVEVLTENITDAAEEILVGNGDFTLAWDGGEAAAQGYFMDGMYPDCQELALGERISGTLIFEVPKGIDKFKLVYKEVWDDQFEGNTYAIICCLK